MDYERVVEELMHRAANELRGRGDDSGSVRTALCRYLYSGKLAGLSQGELIDFLGVSSPSALEGAAFSELQQERAMLILGDLSDAEIEAHGTYPEHGGR